MIHNMQVNDYHHFESQKSISGNTKLIPVAPDDILGSYEVERWVQQDTEHYLQHYHL